MALTRKQRDLFILFCLLFVLSAGAICLYFIFFRNKQNKHNNSVSDSLSSHVSTMPEDIREPEEVPEPVEPGFKDIAGDLVCTSPVLNLMALLDKLFVKDMPPPNIEKAREFVKIQKPYTEDYGSSNDLHLVQLLISNSTVEDFLSNARTRIFSFRGILDNVMGGISACYQFEFFLHRFLFPQVFDPQAELALLKEAELQLLNDVLIETRRLRKCQVYLESAPPDSTYPIELFPHWDDLRKFIQGSQSQRSLLLKLCFVSFDGLSTVPFSQQFSEFLKLPRAAPWITNNRLLMMHWISKKLVPIFIEYKLMSAELVNKLLECEHDSLKEICNCLDSRDDFIRKNVALFYFENSIVPQFPLWPLSCSNSNESGKHYPLFQMAVELKDHLNELPDTFDPNSYLKTFYRRSEYKDLETLEFSVGLFYTIRALKQKVSKNDSESWSRVFASDRFMVYRYDRIEKLWIRFRDRIDQIGLIVQAYLDGAGMDSVKIDLIREIYEQSSEVFPFAFELNEAELSSVKSWPVFALLADITRYEYFNGLYIRKDEPSTSNLLKYDEDLPNETLWQRFFRMPPYESLYVPLYSFLSFQKDKEGFIKKIELLNKGLVLKRQNSYDDDDVIRYNIKSP